MSDEQSALPISAHAWAIPLHFGLPVAGGTPIPRLVHAYLVRGSRETALIDCGTASCADAVLAGIAAAGVAPDAVRWLIATHEHADHMGSAAGLAREYRWSVLAGSAARRWLEDAPLQGRERPLFQFDDIMGGSVHVDRALEDGDVIDLGECQLRVLTTPGHSVGSISLMVEPDGLCITGDVLISAVGAPFYDDPAAVLASVARLREVQGGGTRLYASHAPTPSLVGAEALDQTVALVGALANGTAQAAAELGRADEDALVRRALDLGGWPASPVMPITRITVRTHLDQRDGA